MNIVNNETNGGGALKTPSVAAAESTSAATTTFLDRSPGLDIKKGPGLDSSACAGDCSEELSLGSFLERPVLIKEIAWSVAGSPITGVYPWHAFLTHARVANRIANYRYVRGTLKVKAVINGNGFYYGRMLAYYNHKVNLWSEPYSVAGDDYLLLATQRPCFYMDPTTSCGGEMTLPFVNTVNGLDLQDPSALTDFGDLVFKVLVPLAHATDATAPDLSISVFAWMEDVELFGTTSTNMSGLVAQAGELGEYGSGPISKVASAVANAAGALSKIPILTPYMLASQAAAKAVGKVASIFGYSRPANINDINRIVPTYGGNLASCNGRETSMKLTMDQLQEVTIDPRVVGVSPMDEMVISTLTSREAYVGAFQWDATNVRAHSLCNIAVGPDHWIKGVAGGGPFYFTPSCFIGRMFKYWRGTIKYRFKIVASTFHKGRLRFTFNPNTTSSATDVDFNVLETVIVDLDEQRDFTLEIGWARNKNYLKTTQILNLASGQKINFTGGVVPNISDDEQLGTLQVSVQTPLTTPDITQSPSITVAVFASTGDDFEFAAPRSIPAGNTYSFYQPQSGELEDPGAFADSCNDEPNKPSDAVIAGDVEVDDNVPSIYFGEKIVSLRSLLKRFSYYYSTRLDSGVGPFVYASYESDMPLIPGYANIDGIHTTSTAVKYNYVSFTPLAYLSAMFLSRRGGIRQKLIFVGSEDAIMSVSRKNDPTGGYAQGYNSLVGVNNSGFSRAHQESMSSCSGGGIMTVCKENPVLEFETPYYLDKRFQSPKLYSRGNDLFEDATNWHEITVTCPAVGGSASDLPSLHRYVAAADDFSLSYFVSTPAVWMASVPSS